MPKEKREDFTPEFKTELLWRDGFIDRYSTTREKLIHPMVLRILSECMQDEFPYDSHWNMKTTHIAYYQLYPSFDHIIPNARGGTNKKNNLVCTSYLRNQAKGGYTPEELQWAKDNEVEIWQYFIENELLFSTNPKLPLRFIVPAPFSKFNLSIDKLSYF